MASSSNPSASIIVAAVVEIVGCGLALLGSGFALLSFRLMSTQPDSPELPAFAKSMAEVMMVFFAALAIFGIFTAVGLIRLKNWARIVTLIFAGMTTFFSAVVMLFGLLLPFPTVPNQPPNLAHYMRFFVFFFYAIPCGIGIWWLILFTRKTIVAQFDLAGAPLAPSIAMLPGEPFPPASPARPARPSCPLPVAVVAGFSIFSCLSLVFLLFARFPVVVFGHLIHSPASTVILVLSCALHVIVGIGLLTLKPWSHPVAIAVQLFWLLSGTVSLLSSNYEAILRESLSAMRMTVDDVYSAQYFQHLKAFSAIGLIVPVIILAILIYYRSRFLEAASAAASRTSLPRNS